mmetsp:Transcript_31879/g.35507  ORF Transcript_31879/g.35507 Transcript_31879/m.35507 type:complete len:139 (-) Transcript_31879:404-820(-)
MMVGKQQSIMATTMTRTTIAAAAAAAMLFLSISSSMMFTTRVAAFNLSRQQHQHQHQHQYQHLYQHQVLSNSNLFMTNDKKKNKKAFAGEPKIEEVENIIKTVDAIETAIDTVSGIPIWAVAMTIAIIGVGASINYSY